MFKDLNNYLELIESNNINVFDMFCKANSIINNEKYKNVMVSVSGK